MNGIVEETVENSRYAIVRTPILGPLALFVARTRYALSYYYSPLLNLVRWLFRSNETTNLTYDLELNNRNYLAALIAHVLGIEFSTVVRFIDEIENDAELKRHIIDTTTASRLGVVADSEVRFGRRIGWYAFVRALKPRVVIETGVDKGLGACVLTAALMKNREEGYEGRYYGTDINPDAGYLLSGKYANCGQIIYGDSLQSLRKFGQTVDLFINDSDHSADYEAAEYEAVADKLSDGAVVLGDNSHATGRLLDFSLAKGRQFVFFAEKPSQHWYPGGGIGISFR
ncbi:MAG: class I SAM-dependent methyltransferase [Actinomycetota bacterium]